MVSDALAMWPVAQRDKVVKRHAKNLKGTLGACVGGLTDRVCVLLLQVTLDVFYLVV